MSTGFAAASLAPDALSDLAARRSVAAADIVRLVSLATCGHPGGSLSTIDALLTIYAHGNLSSAAPRDPDRDRVVVSHGHVSPAVYATLANFGYFDIHDAYVGFRRAGSRFGGHVESVVPGVEWNTGNLGQGLSAGCGFALAARLNGRSYRTFVLMGDGEQQKGQVSEARRFAAKYRLSSLVALVDVNGLQIGGNTADIMPIDLAAVWEADGWNVIHVDGHDFAALYDALRKATHGGTESPDRPTVLLLRTVMGKGIPKIENDAKYHGQALPDALALEAIAAFGQEPNLAELRARRAAASVGHDDHTIPVDRDIRVTPGTPRTYAAGLVTDCRSAYGDALHDLAVANGSGGWPIVGLSCDLEGSVKMNAFHKETPDRFVEVGIMEHHAAVLAGALSKEGIVPFLSTFGMFATAETYNQQRLNDQNGAAPKVVVTHCGLDVGEDGPTHQCIDYVGLMRGTFGFEIYSPADANECDRIVRYAATRYAPIVVAMGRSKLPTIGAPTGEPALAGDFVPGRWTTLRPGDDAVVFAFGAMVYRAVEASDTLAAEGFGLRVVNASSLQPVDVECILECARTAKKLLTYEDHNVNTGLGAIVAATLGDAGVAAKLQRLGVSRYGTSGTPDELFAAQGLAVADLIAAARK
ncbi:MAG: transketolase [Myxococcales bacterium]|nr:transketolase [Myxococcales bacterium]MCB9531171.1 transketolase [Myxococcales bacterium]